MYNYDNIKQVQDYYKSLKYTLRNYHFVNVIVFILPKNNLRILMDS